MKTPMLFCNEIKNGRVEAVKAFVKQCIHEKKAEYQDLLTRYDLNDTRFWVQTMHGKSYLLFTHNMGPEGYNKLAEWNDSQHPFDVWFKEQLGELFANDHDTQQPEYLDNIEVA